MKVAHYTVDTRFSTCPLGWGFYPAG